MTIDQLLDKWLSEWMGDKSYIPNRVRSDAIGSLIYSLKDAGFKWYGEGNVATKVKNLIIKVCVSSKSKGQERRDWEESVELDIRKKVGLYFLSDMELPKEPVQATYVPPLPDDEEIPFFEAEAPSISPRPTYKATEETELFYELWGKVDFLGEDPRKNVEVTPERRKEILARIEEIGLEKNRKKRQQ